jgi:hypothetical protein
MANQIRKLYQDILAQSFEMRALLRLAAWGGAAAGALMLAVLSAYWTSGSRTAIAMVAPGDPRTAVITTQLAARSNELEAEARRLSEAVTTLTADRERLITRITSLERSLEDVTGSIKRQTTAAPPAATAGPPALPAIAFAPAPLAGGPPPRQGPKDAEAATPPPAPEQPPAQLANVPANLAPPAAAPEEDQAKGEYAVDLGGSANFDGMRALWNAARKDNAALFKNLQPLVTVREGKARGVELRLIVGPLASTEHATRMCAALLAARRSCQMTMFEGQPLPRPAPPDPPAEKRTERPPAANTPARDSGKSNVRTGRP